MGAGLMIDLQYATLRKRRKENIDQRDWQDWVQMSATDELMRNW